MNKILEPPKTTFNIDNLIRDFEKDAGIFIVLLGLERKKEEISKYLFALFDSAFYGQKTRPRTLFRSQKYEEGPMFFFDGLYTIDFHSNNNFFYSILETDKTIDREQFFREFYKDIYLRLNEDLGHEVSDTQVKEVIDEMWKGGKEEFEETLKVLDSVPNLLPFGRFGEQLAQVQLRNNQFNELYAECQKEKNQNALFTLMQTLFPEEKIKNYIKTNRKLVLPEHQKIIFTDLY